MLYYKVLRAEIDKTSRTVIEGTSKVVWEGTDVKELEIKFPRKYFTNGNTLDQLRIVRMPKSTLCTIFLTRKSESGEWELSEDPRYMVIVNPLTKEVLLRTPAQIKKDMEVRRSSQ